MIPKLAFCLCLCSVLLYETAGDRHGHVPAASEDGAAISQALFAQDGRLVTTRRVGSTFDHFAALSAPWKCGTWACYSSSCTTMYIQL